MLGSDREQGFITREVTRELNRAALVALAILAWDVFATRDPSRLRLWVRAALWVFMVLCQALLFVLHAHLDRLVSALESEAIASKVFRETFRPGHRVYLWTHTLQWFSGLMYIGLMLVGWKEEDQYRSVKGMVDRK